MITDEKALLEPYLYKDDLRPTMQKPFTCKGYVYATDAMSMLRVRQDLLKGEYIGHPKAPNAEACLQPHNFDKVLTLQQLEAVIAQCPMEEEEEIMEHPDIECDECHGDGEVEWEYCDSEGHCHHEYYDCPICGGSGIKYRARYRKTGRSVPEFNACVSVYGQCFRASLLMRVCDTMKCLNVGSIRYVANYSGKANTFNLADGIEVILMPIVGVEPYATIQ